MASAGAIEVAQAQLWIDKAAIVIGVPLVAVAGWDAGLIRFRDTSVSRVCGNFANDHPLAFWSLLLGGAITFGLHCTGHWRDPLDRLGALIRGQRSKPL